MSPRSAAGQASLSLIISRSLLKLMSIESVMRSNHLILCHPLLLLPSLFPSIRVFSNESPLHIRWPKYWSFNFSLSPSNEYSGLISFRINWFDHLAVQGLSRVFSNTTVQKHQFLTFSLFYGPILTLVDDSCHEIKRCLLLGRKAMTNLDSILRNRDITLLTKIHIIKATGFFPVVIYQCENWTIKKAECQKLMLLNCGVVSDSL